MVFFLRKGDTEASSQGQKSVPDRVVALSVVEKPKVAAEPSPEGKALTQRISGTRTAVPNAFFIKADTFHLEGQSAIAGRLELVGELIGRGKTEISRGGMICGAAICEDMTISGVFDGDGLFDRVSIAPGGECRGRVKSESLILSEGGILDGEFSKK